MVRRIRLEKKADQVYEGVDDDVVFGLSYAVDEERFTLTASIRHGGRFPFSPERAGVRLGIDCVRPSTPNGERSTFQRCFGASPVISGVTS